MLKGGVKKLVPCLLMTYFNYTKFKAITTKIAYEAENVLRPCISPRSRGLKPVIYSRE